MSVVCVFCGEPVDPESRRNTWHRVTGWERKGAAGGSDIALRRGLDEYACAPCIKLQQQGHVPTQTTLV